MTRTQHGAPAAWELSWAMTAHLSALCLYLGFVLANLGLPYLIWRWKRTRSAYVGAHALAALNFQITVTAAGAVTTLVAMAFPLVWLAVMAIFTANIVYIGIAADRARDGRMYRYPFAIDWLRAPTETGPRPSYRE